MRREVVVLAAAAVVLVLVAAGVTVLLSVARQESESPPRAEADAPEPDEGQPDEQPAPQPQGPPMDLLAREAAAGVAAEVARAAERVSRPGRSRVALHRRDGGRWVCILVDGPERYVRLDRGLSPEQFPALEAQGFRAPPPHIVRATTSIYRSVAKAAMDYDQARGDRIVVLVCPRDQWDALDLRWPPPAGEASD
ncbi:MAG: hypothetical protein ACLF0G_15070 [Candidatus Brocadiia bacterium]